MTEKLARLWLSMGDIPSAKLAKVLECFDSAQAFYEEREKAGPLLGENIMGTLAKWADPKRLGKLMEDLEQQGVCFITPDDAVWPRGFRWLHDPPAGLFIQGNAQALNSHHAFAMVGTRRASIYGRRMAKTIATDLAKSGVTVVSGFAVGIDSAAHEGCVCANGRTLAVMGCGLDVDYPSCNAALRRRILENGGALVSEYPPGAQPLAFHFPQRNRLIAALSQGLMLVEGASHSGGMISAHLALEMGLEVFALPGPADASGSVGPHGLIRDGARLAVSAQQILEDMGWEIGEKPFAPSLSLDGEEKVIVSLLETQALSFDELSEQSHFSADTLNSHLTILELKGIIEKSPGRIYAKVR